jgi:hypothetical protein
MNFSSFFRPTSIEWVYPALESGSEWFTHVQSSSLQKLAKQLDTLFAENGIEVTRTPLTEEVFNAWLPFYTEKMLEQGHEVMATIEWFHKRSAENRQLYVVDFIKDKKRIGTTINSTTPERKHTQHFKASDRVDVGNQKNASLGALIDLRFIQQAVQQNASVISSSTSRNGFGYFNTIGYLTFKLKLGYKPMIAPTATFDQDFAQEEANPVIWFVTSSPNLSAELLVLISNPDFANDEVKKYLEKIPNAHTSTK